MSKLVFLFLTILYLIVSILSFSKGLDMNTQLMVSGIVICLFGIPHGAIDHVLFMDKSKTTPFLFFSFYIMLMIGYLILWYFVPTMSLVLFLALSAYHFGETQLSNILGSNSKRVLIYALWGINLLSALIYYNNEEIINVFSTFPDLIVLLPIFDDTIHFIVLAASSIVLFVLLLIGLYQNLIFKEELAKEVFTLALIHISFIILPLLPGFTLYFVVLHSLRVLQDEFAFFRKRVSQFSLYSFIKKLLPFTITSFLGGLILILLVHFDLLNISYVLLSIILISVITLPHTFVMYRFYEPDH